MKGLILAALFFLAFVFLSIPILRFYKGRKYYKLVLLETIGILSFYFFFYDSISFVEFMNGFFFLSVLCLSHLNFIHGSFLTGFSTGILIKTLQKDGRGITLEELLEAYGSQDKMDRVLGPRINNLIKGGYLKEEEGGHFRPLTKGRFFARITRFLKKLLNCGAGG